MAAGLLQGGAAGMKNVAALFRWQRGEIELLESEGGHRRDVAPMPDGLRRGFSRLAKPAIWPIMRKLQREHGQRQFVEAGFVRACCRREGMALNELAHLRDAR